MEITTKYNMDDTVHYLERKRISEQCPACEGSKRVNVTTGTFRWNIKCPNCNGKGKLSEVIRYDVVSDIVKGVIIKCGKQTSTKYILKNGIHKREMALFVTMEDAKQKCKELNEQLKQSKNN
ncbi:MAG: hypothetical protein IKL08_01490 [Clostridia bacterium]|nr:hypothetical protein [Clostridia bacterium]